jgi:hypothetical protein
VDNLYSQAALLIGPEMTRVSVSAVVHAKLASGARCVGGWPTSTLSWIVTAFLIAVASVAVVLAIFGVGERGTTIALRLTARWSFVLFWFAYTGSALARLFGSRLARLARHGRDFGLAFASAQVVHVGLVIWLFYLAPGANGGMVFFWVGILCTYLLALFSLPRLRNALGPRLWRISCMIAMEYIALVFFVDFIRIPLQGHGLGDYPLSYLPFALMLVGGVGLRAVSFARFATHRQTAAPAIASAGVKRSMVMRSGATGSAFQRQENV